jgi:hypothetical protein
MECVVKALRDVKVIGSKPTETKKSNHAKGWCGSGRVRSSGDFDGLDAHESQFLKPQASPTGHEQTSKQKKKNYILGQSTFSFNEHAFSIVVFSLINLLLIIDY